VGYIDKIVDTIVETSPLSCRLFCRCTPPTYFALASEPWCRLYFTGERAISFSMEKSLLSCRWLARQCKIVDTIVDTMVSTPFICTGERAMVSTILHWRASHRHDSGDFSIENEMARSPVQNSRHDSGDHSYALESELCHTYE